jgi:hypothetical protein
LSDGVATVEALDASGNVLASTTVTNNLFCLRSAAAHWFGRTH